MPLPGSTRVMKRSPSPARNKAPPYPPPEISLPQGPHGRTWTLASSVYCCAADGCHGADRPAHPGRIQHTSYAGCPRDTQPCNKQRSSAAIDQPPSRLLGGQALRPAGGNGRPNKRGRFGLSTVYAPLGAQVLSGGGGLQALSCRSGCIRRLFSVVRCAGSGSMCEAGGSLSQISGTGTCFSSLRPGR